MGSNRCEFRKLSEIGGCIKFEFTTLFSTCESFPQITFAFFASSLELGVSVHHLRLK